MDADIRPELRSTSSVPSRVEHLTPIDRRLAGLLVRALRATPVRVVLWDGTELSTQSPAAISRIHVRNRRALLRLLVHPHLYFGECYSEGSIDVDGDLPDTLTALGDSLAEPRGVHAALTRAYAHLHRIDPLRSRHNVHHHYDLGNDFYRLWLDARMVYTCAYFPSPAATLEDAQVAKLDHVCRKLRLKPGEEVIEAGCGWGALALHMAGHYGVRVRAFNVSREQVGYAREAAARSGVADRVDFIEDDYRSATGTCDAFVSVGMLEHVGPPNYRGFGRQIRRLVKPDGRGLLHFIGRSRPAPTNPWIRRRIFPDGYTPSLREMMPIFESNGFAVMDVENLRTHYARTLAHWFARYEQAAPRVRAMFDESFVRTWRLYLAGSTAAFRSGSMQLFQVLFARPSGDDLPPTRADLYRNDG